MIINDSFVLMSYGGSLYIVLDKRRDNMWKSDLSFWFKDVKLVNNILVKCE